VPDDSALNLRRVEVAPDVRLNVATALVPGSMPIVLLPAYADSWSSWSLVIPALARHSTIVAIDARGHGDSDRPSCCYGVDDVAQDVIAVLDALGIERAIVVGHSGSCFAARRLAVLHPARVAGLGLIAAPMALDREALAEFVESVEELRDPVPESFIRDFQSGTTHRPLPDDFLEGLVSASSKLPARVWRDTLAGLLAFRDEHDLGRITVPTVLIWGDRDPIIERADQDRLHAAIAASQLVVLEGVGHSANWEAPDSVVRCLLEILPKTA
jgi:non-heme chloroperoxidase